MSVRLPVGSPCPLPAILAACVCAFLLWCVPSAASAAAGCDGASPPLVGLSMVSGAFRGAEHERITVRVHENGCVLLRRPWYWREAGVYEIRLEPAEWEALRAELALEALRGVSAESLRREAEALDKREAGSTAIEYRALDADAFALHWREGEVQRELVWADLLEDAERHPQAAGINALASTVRTLQSLLQREGKRIEVGVVR